MGSAQGLCASGKKKIVVLSTELSTESLNVLEMSIKFYDAQGSAVAARVAVGWKADAYVDAAQQLARQLMLPVIAVSEWKHYDAVVFYTEQGLALQQRRLEHARPFCVDFSRGVMQQRLATLGRRAPLVRAVCGAAKSSDGHKHKPSVLDATAGFGRDALLLAKVGCSVVMLERSAVVHALLRDALDRAARVSSWAEICARLTLHCVEACTHMQALVGPLRPDVIYIDPMFPRRDKTALVKKEMQVLQGLASVDGASGLLAVALQVARQRVVVKRPRWAGYLDERLPMFSCFSPAMRFDVYSMIDK